MNYRNILSSFRVLLVSLFLLLASGFSDCYPGELTDKPVLLKVERFKEHLSQPYGEALIYLDGELIGQVYPEESVEYEIPALNSNRSLRVRFKFSGLSDLLYWGITHNIDVPPTSPGDLVYIGLHLSNIGKKLNIQTQVAVQENSTSATNPNVTTNDKPKIIWVKLNETLKAKIIKKSPDYNIPSGQEQLIEDTYKLVHTVTTDNKDSLINNLQLEIPFIETSIKKEVQKSISKSDADWTEIKRSVKITGNGKPIKVVWRELYRTGTARLEADGKMTDIDFEYKEDFDLSLEGQ